MQEKRGNIWFKCRKCVILHIIDIRNVYRITFSALKADQTMFKRSIMIVE